MKNLMIFGAGFSGTAIAEQMRSSFDRVGGTTRNIEKFPKLEAAGIQPFQFDGSGFSGQLQHYLSKVTHLIQSISQDKTGEVLIPLMGQFPFDFMPNLKWVGYLSTVGVYGNHDGDWVDETTICKPVSHRSVARLKAEQEWQTFCDQHGLPLSILRLSGIYGPGRNAFVNFDQGKARRLVKKDQVFNRIYVEDIARATQHLIDARSAGIFNVTDDEPAPPQDVVAYAAKLLGVEPPPEIDFETADLSPMARSFYGENKRVSNAKIKALSFEFKYPNYRVALDHLLNERLQSQ